MFFNEVFLLVTVALDIFIKEKNNILYLPMQKVSTWSKKAKRYPFNHFPTPRISQHPFPPAYRLFGTLDCFTILRQMSDIIISILT